ncbi:MAG: deoxyguanosinetriphosphate triphosphohydrolase [Steroidobacteraceae bacterium]
MDTIYSAALAPYAVHDELSRGRRYVEQLPTFRSEFQRDRDRIIHSTAFRRLVYKTQVFVNQEGDLYRTRLTHSLEVAQIARTIARELHLNETLTEAICLAHDLGHTPFGHAGQDALNECMRDYGGFEHNLQSLRIVDELEERYATFNGLNLCFETREGILKHCSLKHAQQLGEVGERFIRREQASLEAQVANLADEIAYNNHDLDDGLRAELISLDDAQECMAFRIQHAAVMQAYPALAGRRLVHEVVRRLINQVVTDVVDISRQAIEQAAPIDINAVRTHPKPLIQLSADTAQQHLELKRFLRERVYRHYRVLRMTNKAQQVVKSLFDAFMQAPELMPPEYQYAAKSIPAETNAASRARAVADYIAGMTDRYAVLEHERMFDPGKRS